MAVHIYSQDRTSGQTYDGIWTLNAPITGTYKLVSQIIDTTPIPWITLDSENMQIANGGLTVETFDIFSSLSDYNTYRYADDLSAFATYLVARINAVGALHEPVHFGVTGELINEDTQLKLTSTNGNMVFLWSQASCSKVFGKNADESGTVFYLNLYNVTTSPPHLYMTIDESNLPVTTTNSFVPNLILATQDSPLLGQHVRFRNTSTLTIKLYLINILGDTIDCYNSWELVFLPG